MSDTTTLESLPVDVLILILKALPDFQSIKSAVHAAPALHQAYLGAQYCIWSSVLKTEYGLGILSDAIAAVRSKGLSASVPAYKEPIKALLEKRRLALYDKPADLDEIYALLHLHKVAVWFLDDFKRTMVLPDLMFPKLRGEISMTGLSAEEKARMFRGFYRFQILVNIVRGGTLDDENKLDPDGETFTSQDMIRLFFLAMPPCEIEEIGCIRVSLSYKIACHLHPLQEDLDDAEWEFLRCHSMWLPNQLLLLVVDGPEFVRSLISQPRQVLVEFIPTDGLIPEDWEMAEHTRETLWRHLLFEGVIEELFSETPGDPEEHWPFIYPADQYGDLYRLQERVATLPIDKQPTLHWITSDTRGVPYYSDSFHDLFECREFGWDWAWGNVFWDQWRFGE